MRPVTITEYMKNMANTPAEMTLCIRADGNSQIWNCKKHKHDYAEIMYFLCGTMLINANNHDYYPKASGIIFYPPGVEHKETRTSSQLQEAMTIGYRSPVTPVAQNAFLLSDKDGVFRSLFHQIYTLKNNPQTETTDELLEPYRRTLFLQMVRFHSDKSLHTKSVAKIISAYMQEHYYEDLTLAYLTNLVSISPSQLIRTFNQEFHIPPGKYLEQIRIESAVQLLKNSSLRINEISEQVGYPDTSYFWRVFKKQTGSSPSAYRKRDGSFDPSLQ